MQQEENYLAQSISQVDADARYDEGVKRLLANKSILAVIMKECVPEYHGCTVRGIAEKYIEGEPQIGAVGVDADETNRNVSATIRHEYGRCDADRGYDSLRCPLLCHSTERGWSDWADFERGGTEPLQCRVSAVETCNLLLQPYDLGAVRHGIYQRRVR